MAACHRLTLQICVYNKAVSCWFTVMSFLEIIYRTVDLHTLSSCSLLSPAICLAIRVGLQNTKYFVWACWGALKPYFSRGQGFKSKLRTPKNNHTRLGWRKRNMTPHFCCQRRDVIHMVRPPLYADWYRWTTGPFTEPKTPVSHIALKLSGALFRNRQTDVDVDCLAMCPQGTLLAGYFPVELYGLCKVLNLCLPVSYSLPWFIHSLRMVLVVSDSNNICRSGASFFDVAKQFAKKISFPLLTTDVRDFLLISLPKRTLVVSSAWTSVSGLPGFSASRMVE